MWAKPENSQYKEEARDMEAELRRRERMRRFSMWEILGVNPPDPVDYHAILYEDPNNEKQKVFLRNEDDYIILFDTPRLARDHQKAMREGIPETRLVVEVGTGVWRDSKDPRRDIPFLAPTQYDPTLEVCVVVLKNQKRWHRAHQFCRPRDAKSVWFGSTEFTPKIVDMFAILVRGEPMRESVREQLVVFETESLAKSARTIAQKGVTSPIKVAHHTRGIGRDVDAFGYIPVFGDSAGYEAAKVITKEEDLFGLRLLEP